MKYLIRDDYLMEAYEMLLTCCDDLTQSAGLIAREKQLDQDLVPPAKSLLYACGRINAPELDRLKEQFESKFGKEFVDVNTEVGKTTVDPSLIVKLSMRTPDVRLVNKYLVAIAQIFNVPWQAPPEEPLLNESLPMNVSLLPTVGLATDDYTAPPPPYSPDMGHIFPQEARDGASRSSGSPGSGAISGSPGSGAVSPPSAPSSSGVPDFEELTRRFKALKNDK